MKRLGLIGLVLICLMIAVSMILPVSAASSYLRGDADGDGLNIIDATNIQRYLAGFPNIYHIEESVTVPDPTTPQPTTPQPTRDPYELPVVPKK